MNTETGIVGPAAALARINSFYLRRVLQRWQRGEIDKGTAIELLHAAAFGTNAHEGAPNAVAK